MKRLALLPLLALTVLLVPLTATAQPRPQLSPVHWMPIVHGGAGVAWDQPPPLRGAGATYTGPWFDWAECETTIQTLPGMAAWYHNWGAQTHQIPSGIEFVPTIYSPSSIGQSLDGNSPYLLTFNEPRGEPESYVDSWIQAAEFYSDKHVFLPSVHQDTLWWLDAFYAELARRGRTDLAYGISFHIYQRAPSAALLELERVGQRADAWGLDVWITEYAFDPCWDGGLPWAIQVMEQVAAECEARGWRYAWFQHSYPLPQVWWHGCNTSLVDYDSGEMTELGQAYRRLP